MNVHVRVPLEMASMQRHLWYPNIYIAFGTCMYILRSYPFPPVLFTYIYNDPIIPLTCVSDAHNQQLM